MTHSAPQAPATHAPPIGIRGYFLVLFLLLVLLVLTVWIASFPIGELGTIPALLIAAAKTALVVLFFMHLKYSSRITWAFAAAGLLWLSILIFLTAADYTTRGWFPRGETLTPHPSFIPPPPNVPGRPVPPPE